jgi:hypothetical protein
LIIVALTPSYLAMPNCVKEVSSIDHSVSFRCLMLDSEHQHVPFFI